MNQIDQNFGFDFDHLPRNEKGEYMTRITTIGEIVECQDFDNDEIFISYELVLPNDWMFDYDEDLIDPKDAHRYNTTNSNTQISKVSIV